jgi:hypothetical protein
MEEEIIVKKSYFTKPRLSGAKLTKLSSTYGLALAMRRFSILAVCMMFVFAVSLCVSSNASAQGQGQGQTQGGGPTLFSWNDNGYGAVSTTGSIQIGDGGDVCDGTTAGTIRWTGTDFEGCDGTEWVSLSSPGSGHVHYAIGDTGPAGGIVFYTTDGGLHGLEAAPADQDGGSGAEWGCYGTLISGADGTDVGTGAQNTADILAASCNTATTAASIADAYMLNGYDDWFLPSKDELNLLYQQKDVVGGFASFYYWSSSEYNSDFAWLQSFIVGFQDYRSKSYALRVRAVRAF